MRTRMKLAIELIGDAAWRFREWLTDEPQVRRLQSAPTWINKSLPYISVLLLLLIFVRLGNISPVNVDGAGSFSTPPEAMAEGQEQELEGNVELQSYQFELSKTLQSAIEFQCNRYEVDPQLVYAVIFSGPPTEDGVPRFGIMKLHPGLISKYDAKYPQGVGVVESVYSNVECGVERLAWALEDNATLEDALMAYIYTKPEAQKMWADGIKTTKWVEEVKGAILRELAEKD